MFMVVVISLCDEFCVALLLCAWKNPSCFDTADDEMSLYEEMTAGELTCR